MLCAHDETRFRLDSGPDIARVDIRPEGYCQTFKAGNRIEDDVDHISSSDDLKNKIPDGARTYIHLQMDRGWELTLMVKRSEAATTAMHEESS